MIDGFSALAKAIAIIGGFISFRAALNALSPNVEEQRYQQEVIRLLRKLANEDELTTGYEQLHLQNHLEQKQRLPLRYHRGRYRSVNSRSRF